MVLRNVWTMDLKTLARCFFETLAIAEEKSPLPA
jgi:hypothetical protein